MIAHPQQLVLHQIAVIGAVGAVHGLQQLVTFVQHQNDPLPLVCIQAAKDGGNLVAAPPAFG